MANLLLSRIKVVAGFCLLTGFAHAQTLTLNDSKPARRDTSADNLSLPAWLRRADSYQAPGTKTWLVGPQNDFRKDPWALENLFNEFLPELLATQSKPAVAAAAEQSFALPSSRAVPNSSLTWSTPQVSPVTEQAAAGSWWNSVQIDSHGVTAAGAFTVPAPSGKEAVAGSWSDSSETALRSTFEPSSFGASRTSADWLTPQSSADPQGYVRSPASPATGSVVSAPQSPSSATIFATGFDSPGYSLGTVVGQHGWYQDNGTSTAFLVQNATVHSGNQALLMNPTGQPNFSNIVHQDSYDPRTTGNDKFVIYSAAIYISSAGTAGAMAFQAVDSNLNEFVQLQIYGNGTLELDGQGSGVVIGSVTLNTWHVYQIELNFNTDQARVLVDGSMKGIGIGSSGWTDIGGEEFVLNFIATGTAPYFLDDVDIFTSAVPIPEPATWAMGALVSLGLVVGAKFRVRRAGQRFA